MENGNGQLGQIVAWRVPNQVSIGALRDALTAANFSEELAGDLHPRFVLTRALRDMRESRVIAKLAKAGDKASFQLTHVSVGEDRAVYSREAVVSLDLHSGVVSADDAVIEERARQLVAEHAGKRLTNDLTRLVQKIYDEHRADLVPLREQGGVYFVPDAQRALVDRTRSVLGAIGGRLSSYAVRLGCADTAESVAESMTDYLTGLVTEFRTSCAKVGPDSRSDVAPRRMAKIGELRARLESYRGLLRGYADSIGDAIDAAETDLLTALAQPKVEDETVQENAQ